MIGLMTKTHCRSRSKPVRGTWKAGVSVSSRPNVTSFRIFPVLRQTPDFVRESTVLSDQLCLLDSAIIAWAYKELITSNMKCIRAIIARWFYILVLDLCPQEMYISVPWACRTKHALTQRPVYENNKLCSVEITQNCRSLHNFTF